MKPLIVSTFDTQGGAARAAYRLHHGLRKCDVDSRMLVQEKTADDYTVRSLETKGAYLLARIRANFDIVPLCLYPKRCKTFFSSAILPDSLKDEIYILNPDVVHLHWVSYGFMRVETLAAIRRPIVWTLHDMWPFTGGCHYSEGCDHYLTGCGCCPLLASTKHNDLSRWNWNRKSNKWLSLPMTIVSPSRWLADCARKSPLFKNSNIVVIPNGIDIKRFSPRNKRLCRDILSLPQNKKIILCGGINCRSDRRKGFDLLLSALLQLKATVSDVELVIIGESQPDTVPEVGFPINYLGMLNDEISLALAYCCADVFVAPSREENLSNMVMESIACGLPCVAFDIGGMPDMIEPGFNGFLASPFDPADLAAGMARILTDNSLQSEMSHRSRKKSEREFAIELVARRYSQLYQEVCMHTAVGE
ncbi:MAG: glycosyltransferase family 4 protein [Desulfuromonadaceae bacterium]|nr:glycosyltransferase family 4 protein [Desulfuromonadaceae bacterium]